MRKKRTAREYFERLYTIYKNQGLLCTWGILVTYFMEDSTVGRFIVRILFKDKIYTKDLNGYKMNIVPRNYDISTEIAYTRCHEKAASREFMNQLSPGMRILDIGANIGYYALMEAHIIGNSGKVYAIEPHPPTYELLINNIKLNDFTHRIAPFQMSIGDSIEEAKLFFSEKSNLNSMIPNNEAETDQFCMVKKTTLDKFTEDTGPIDFLRMDVESYEYEIIQGAKVFLDKCKNIKLFAEIHDEILEERGISVEGFFQDLKGIGFRPTAAAFKWKNKVIYDGLNMDNIHQKVKEGAIHVFLEKNHDN